MRSVGGDILFFLLPAPQYAACNGLAEQCSCKASECVEEEVPPVGSASGSEQLLPYLDETTEENGRNDTPRNKACGIALFMAPEVFEPQHRAETEVHEKVEHLVYVGHLVKRSFRRIEE